MILALLPFGLLASAEDLVVIYVNTIKRTEELAHSTGTTTRTGERIKFTVIDHGLWAEEVQR